MTRKTMGNDALHLYWFRPHEFGPTPQRDKDWWQEMDARLLILLDVFRSHWGQRVRVSKHELALGRHDGPDDEGDHNIDRHPAVLAADCFPEGITTREEAEFAIELATEVGFTAIGIYPDWRGGCGMHLATRRSREPGDPATWGAIQGKNGQVYVSVDDALLRLPCTQSRQTVDDTGDSA